MRSFTQSFLILSCLVLAACSSNDRRPEDLSEREFYEQAREAMSDNNFLIASERLQQLESRYPFGDYAEQAQLELIYTQHMMSDMEGALASAERFIRLHPLHKQVDYAYYMRGLSVYELGFSFVERYTPSEQARRDPTPFRDAFNHFDELVRRYPDSQYNEDAQKRMIFLRDRLAQYEIGVGHFYMKRHAYLAAAQRGERVMLGYQGTSSVGDALALQVEAYRLLGQKFEAKQALALLKLNYPKHKQLSAKGKFIDSGLTKEDRRTLIGVMSFGLIE
ncbi:MAG: outer membrane protein assembly factor BamD [Oleispira antarctica]|uniref:Outer membrane protein assembly factor BamD n=1 Tax=Oleispira antarctica RB-8 TaxID=698738 RepID=R4YRN8_OLEAN|nr:outer membrane protein assembly factor BamD [Oleispira antarctica]MBQ0791178.1 outer membrane protein assembly factor BamD [Oleispira antarctica]CCK74774.1 Competence lipoprotein ComL [Oleispira antarctica RB-8]|tara:strand:- start:29 stop:859 length:831 start_codon:yes stop_codon:yes gene_type:complete